MQAEAARVSWARSSRKPASGLPTYPPTPPSPPPPPPTHPHVLLQRERELAAKNQLAREEAAKRRLEEQARRNAEKLQQMKDRWKTQATVQKVGGWVGGR